jgi:hypothetical protein
MGLGTSLRTERANMKTIDLTPTWKQILPSLRVIVENASLDGKNLAWEEIARMADAADRYNQSTKAARS